MEEEATREPVLLSEPARSIMFRRDFLHGPFPLYEAISIWKTV